MPRPLLCLALGAISVLVAAAPDPAHAAAPMPCRGVSFADADDAAANRDIREGWFSLSSGRLTANLRLEQVDQRLETGEGAARFAMYYTVRDASRYVAATTDGTAWTFVYGDDGGGSDPPVATAGTVDAGPNGVIEIEVPKVHAAERDTLRSIHARSFTQDAARVARSLADTAPDGDGRRFGYGANFVAEPCPPPSPGPQSQPGPSAPQPEPTPPVASPLVPMRPQTTSPAAPAPFRLTVPRLRARSLARGRTFRVKVDPSAPLEGLTIRLSRGRRVFARGRLASLTRPAAVKVEVGRRIVRGTYRLTVSGRTRAGSRVAGAVVVRVR